MKCFINENDIFLIYLLCGRNERFHFLFFCFLRCVLMADKCREQIIVKSHCDEVLLMVHAYTVRDSFDMAVLFRDIFFIVPPPAYLQITRCL